MAEKERNSAHTPEEEPEQQQDVSPAKGGHVDQTAGEDQGQMLSPPSSGSSLEGVDHVEPPAAATQSPEPPPKKGEDEDHGDTQPKAAGDRSSIWIDIVKKVENASFPISLLGSVLKHLPSLWCKCGVVILCVVVIISTVHFVGPWVRSGIVSVIDSLRSGPPVAVVFANKTGSEVTVDADFRYWILQDEEDVPNPNKAIRGTLPDGAISIPGGGRKRVKFRLESGSDTQRPYRGGCELVLHFKVNAFVPTLEIRDDWGKEVNEPLRGSIVDPNCWRTLPIDIYYSVIDHRDNPDRYSEDHSTYAKDAIAEKLGICRELSVPNASTITVSVGCYETDEPNEGKVCVCIHSDRIEKDDLPDESYSYKEGDSDSLVKSLHGRARRLVPLIRDRVWQKYAPRGTVLGVTAWGTDGPAQVSLDIGSDAGVFIEDPAPSSREGLPIPDDLVFDVYRPADDTKPVARVQITRVGYTESSAKVFPLEPGATIEAGYLVRKHRKDSK